MNFNSSSIFVVWQWSHITEKSWLLDDFKMLVKLETKTELASEFAIEFIVKIIQTRKKKRKKDN